MRSHQNDAFLQMIGAGENEDCFEVNGTMTQARSGHDEFGDDVLIGKAADPSVPHDTELPGIGKALNKITPNHTAPKTEQKKIKVRRLYEHKYALEFEGMELSRIADDLSLMYQIEEERVPKVNYRAYIMPEKLPNMIHGIVKATFLPLRWALGHRSKMDVIHRQTTRDDGGLVVWFMDGMVKFVFEPAVLGLVDVDAQESRGINKSEGETDKAHPYRFRFCDTLMSMTIDRIMRWICHRCIINDSKKTDQGRVQMLYISRSI